METRTKNISYGAIMIGIALGSIFTWGFSLIEDISVFDYTAHYTEWLNQTLVTLIIYTFPFAFIVFLVYFGIRLIKDPD
jgi:hypothetical protein